MSIIKQQRWQVIQTYAIRSIHNNRHDMISPVRALSMAVAWVLRALSSRNVCKVVNGENIQKQFVLISIRLPQPAENDETLKQRALQMGG